MRLNEAQLKALKKAALRSPSVVAFCDINGVEIDDAIDLIIEDTSADQVTSELAEIIIKQWTERQLFG